MSHGDFLVKLICLHLITIMLLSTAFFSMNCHASQRTTDTRKGIYGHVQDKNGSPVDNADVTVFDGFTLNNFKTDIKGEFNISDIPVSKNNYLVIFFTKEGFIPRAENIKAGEENTINLDVVIDKIRTDDSGFIIGVVYQPIRGGKLQYNNGIKGFSKNSAILLEANEKVMNKKTDLNGHYTFEVPAGRYYLSKEGGREKLEIEVTQGKTLIKNLRSGFVLID
ncbi:MAG: carboxypeptidase regulatory-like domain-containing protein [Nitrospirae bacterium]|nr:carboxypeptidase regulatory-like domain-containing protein [Nitrospirota bacterium]